MHSCMCESDHGEISRIEKEAQQPAFVYVLIVCEYICSFTCTFKKKHRSFIDQLSDKNCTALYSLSSKWY